MSRGPGIASEDLPNLFNSFSRLDAEKSGIEGTGIGLVICKNIIEAHEGNITFDSLVDRGTTFRIELPRKDHTKTLKAKAKKKLTTTK